MLSLLRVVAFALLLVLGTGVTAQEVQADCRFEYKPMSARELAQSKEKEAADWFNSFDFSRKKFVLDIASSKIIEPPGSPEVWRNPIVTVASQDIEIDWQFHASPLDRAPRVTIKISRFTGAATESYTMLKAPNQGPRVAYWGRSGTCTLSRRLI